jgi:hypothetical protein
VLDEPSFATKVRAQQKQMARVPGLSVAIRRIEGMVAMKRSGAQLSLEL